MLRLIAILLLVTSLATVAGCGTTSSRPATADAATADDTAIPASPLLRLPPSARPEGLALQQRLTFSHGDRHDTVDALVESDAGSVRILVHAQGQVALRLAWDGETLQQERADWLPPQLQGERVLADLQLVYWPPAAITGALPEGWQLTSSASSRSLGYRGQDVVRVDYLADGTVELLQLRQGFRLRIESQPVTP